METTITNHRDGTTSVTKRGNLKNDADRRELAAFLAPVEPAPAPTQPAPTAPAPTEPAPTPTAPSAPADPVVPPPPPVQAQPSGYCWFGTQHQIPDQSLYAPVVHDRVDIQSGSWVKLDELIARAKTMGASIDPLLRVIPWYGGKYAPPEAERGAYVEARAEATDGTQKALWIPRFADPAFWTSYGERLQAAKQRIQASGVALGACRIDGLGRGGETHYYGVTLPDGSAFPANLQPSDADRLHMARLFVEVFGPNGLTLPTDAAPLVVSGLALHPDLGVWRASLGRAMFLDSLSKKGILDPILQRMANPRATFDAEWYGESPPVDPALGLQQITRLRQAGPARILVGAGNWGKGTDGRDMNRWENWDAVSQMAFLEIGRVVRS